MSEELRRDLALYLRHAVKETCGELSFKALALSTLSLRTINSRLLQLDQEGEASGFKAEIRHNMVLLKAAIRLGIIEASADVRGS